MARTFDIFSLVGSCARWWVCCNSINLAGWVDLFVFLAHSMLAGSELAAQIWQSAVQCISVGPFDTDGPSLLETRWTSSMIWFRLLSQAALFGHKSLGTQPHLGKISLGGTNLVIYRCIGLSVSGCPVLLGETSQVNCTLHIVCTVDGLQTNKHTVLTGIDHAFTLLLSLNMKVNLSQPSNHCSWFLIPPAFVIEKETHYLCFHFFHDLLKLEMQRAYSLTHCRDILDSDLTPTEYCRSQQPDPGHILRDLRRNGKGCVIRCVKTCTRQLSDPCLVPQDVIHKEFGSESGFADVKM